jgi:hypothetical protein
MPITGSKPSVNEEVIRYQARTPLGSLAVDIANAINLNNEDILEKREQAKMIRIWLKALDLKEYLSREQREKIWYALIDIADINDFPIAPILELRERPDILLGGSSEINVTNTYDAGTPFINSDIDTPSEVIDTFAISLSNGV